MVVNFHVGVGMKPKSSTEITRLLTTEPYLQLLILIKVTIIIDFLFFFG